MLCHVAAFAGCLVPLDNFIGPLVVWLLEKDESPVVDKAGKASLNFQMSMMIYGLMAGVLCFVLIGIPLLIGVVILTVVSVIVAGVKAYNGEPYKYPLLIRFLK